MALICAAENGHADCTRLLLDAGADKEAKDVVRGRVRSACGPISSNLTLLIGVAVGDVAPTF